MAWDNCESRRIFETCYAQSEKRMNPLAYWPDSYVWDYSREAGLEQCGLYGEGFHRLGCIGCPMAGEAVRRQEFDRWPGFYRLWIRVLDQVIALRERQGLANNHACGQAWFEWWIQDRAQETYVDENQLMVCGGRVHTLDMNWNVMTDCGGTRIKGIMQRAPLSIYQEYLEARKNPYIIHYAGWEKPWNNPQSDFAEVYWKYARQTPFYEVNLFRLAKSAEVDRTEPTGGRSKARQIADHILPKGTRRRKLAKKILPKGSRRWNFCKKLYKRLSKR